MLMRRAWFCLACVLLCGGAAWSDDAPNDDTPAARVDRLLTATAAGSELEAGAAELVPLLVKLVQEGDPQQIPLAIRALGSIGPDASPAVNVLCERLNDPVHAHRDFASDALVAIGDEAVEPLRVWLASDSGRARAAAFTALHRLGSITIDELNTLASDADPRVRAEVAVALADAGEPGVASLVTLLADDEAAVAVEAARALRVNYWDPSISVPALIDALPRRYVGFAAADALGAYGVDAQRAVPALIANYPLGSEIKSRHDWHDSAEAAIESIGEAHADDVLAICESLLHEDEDARVLAANALATLGPDAIEASEPLLAAIEATIAEATRVRDEFKNREDDWLDNSGSLLHAAKCMVDAHWHITEDAERHQVLLQQLEIWNDDRPK